MPPYQVEIVSVYQIADAPDEEAAIEAALGREQAGEVPEDSWINVEECEEG